MKCWALGYRCKWLPAG